MAGNWNILKMEPCNLPQKLTTGFLKIMKDTAVLILYYAAQIVNGTNHMLSVSRH